MCDIYRVFECRDGELQEIAFINGVSNVKDYLKVSYELNKEPDTFYFAIKIKVD